MKNACRQQGSVTLFVALAMVSLIGFAALVVDVGYLYAYRWKLQYTADAAALASARHINDLINNPTTVALTLAEENGIDPSETVAVAVSTGCWSGVAFTTPCALPNASAVTISDTRTSFFANVLEIASFGFSNTAVALMELNPPQILSGRDVRINGGLQASVSGDDFRIHANANLSVNGQFVVDGDPDNPGNVTLTATGAVTPSSIGSSGANPYTIPPVNIADLEAMAPESQTYPAGTLYVEELADKSGVVYVDGDVTIDSNGAGADLSDVTIVSSGTMTFRASDIAGQTDPSSGGVTVYFVSGGDMKFLGSVDRIEGAVFRSVGEIVVNGGGGVDVILQSVFMVADGDVRVNGGLREIEFDEAVNVIAPPFEMPGTTTRLVL